MSKEELMNHFSIPQNWSQHTTTLVDKLEHVGGNAPCTMYPKIQEGPKLACFVLYVKMINIFLKNNMHLTVNFPRNSKIASELRQAKQFLSYWSQTNILTVLVNKLKTAWPTKISMYFWVPWTFFYINA